jgi:PAS domain S-box-containing protein
MPSQEVINVVAQLDFPGVVLLAADPGHRLLGVNPYGCEIAKQAEPALRGQQWAKVFVDAADQDVARAMFDAFVAGEWGEGRHLETSLRETRLAWRPARVPGSANAVFLLGEDVTARHQMAHDLMTSEAKMHAVVQTAADGIITINDRGIMQTVNQAAVRIFGYTPQEMVGNNVSMLMPSPDREQHDGYLRNYLKTGVAGIIGKGREVTALRKDGTRFPAYLAISEVKDDVRLFTGIVHDLTNEKRLQREMQQQEALATLGRMAAVVAHEVKNPLAGIAGVIQILRGRQPADAPERQIMTDVLDRIDALVDTIQDMLLYARPRELKPVRTNLAELLRESARLLEKDDHAKDVRVDVPDGDRYVEVDIGYFREALLNIFLNAAQAMNGKGAIRAEIEDAGGFCRVRIIDNGPGIPAEIRDKVMEPFFTTKGKGTGLGLALVKRVVERHGGHVSIDCPKGGGTIVTLSLPHTHRP